MTMRVETIGDATLYLADCREVLPKIKANAVVTDPPFGVNLGEQPDRRGDHILVKDRYANYDDTPENFSSVVIPAITTAICNARRGIVFVSGKTAWMLPPPDGIGGVYLPSAQGRFIWGFRSFAPCLFYGRAPDLHLGCKATVFESVEAAPKNGHPCPKPLSWMKWAVSLATSDHRIETVLDPFMGSGTTGVAAIQMGRKFIGIEIESTYFDIARKRIEEASRQADMFIKQPKPFHSTQGKLLFERPAHTFSGK